MNDNRSILLLWQYNQSSNYNLPCLSIQGEVRNISLIPSVSTKCFGAVSDSREERAAVFFTQTVWDHCSTTPTHNHHSIAISKKEQQNQSLFSTNFVEHAVIKITCNALWCHMLKHCKHLDSGFVFIAGEVLSTTKTQQNQIQTFVIYN